MTWAINFLTAVYPIVRAWKFVPKAVRKFKPLVPKITKAWNRGGRISNRLKRAKAKSINQSIISIEYNIAHN